MNKILINVLLILALLFALFVIPPIITALSTLLKLLQNPISTVVGWVGTALKNDEIKEVANNVKENLNVAATFTGALIMLSALVMPLSNIFRIGLGFLGLLLIKEGSTNLAKGDTVRTAVLKAATRAAGVSSSDLKTALASKEVKAVIQSVKAAPLASYFEN